MKKKITAIFLCIALAATAIVGASLAYFTDTDNAKNTFTVGNVDITLQEGTKKDLNNGTVNLTNWSEKNPNGAQLMPGTSSDGNAVSKIITVKNNNANAAWVWVELKIPAALLDENWWNSEKGGGGVCGSGDDFNALHINEYGAFCYNSNGKDEVDPKYLASAKADGIIDNDGKTVDGMVENKNANRWDGFNVIGTETINNVEYVVLRSCMMSPLKSGETSLPCLRQVYMDWRLYANADGGYTFPKTTVSATKSCSERTIPANTSWEIIVDAYAIQADGIASVENAVELFQTNATGEYHPTDKAVTDAHNNAAKGA